MSEREPEGRVRRRRAMMSGLIGEPWLCRALLALVAVQLGLVTWTGAGWPCPSRALAAWPCPGCGLSRAGVALLKGELGRAAELHALIFPGALLGALIGLGAALPAAARGRLSAVVRRWEGGSAGALAIPLGALAYYGVRLWLGGGRIVALDGS